jgi:hypothetical protein
LSALIRRSTSGCLEDMSFWKSCKHHVILDK